MTLNPMKCRRKNALKMQNGGLIPEFKLYGLHHSTLIILLNVYYTYCIHMSKYCMSFN